MTATHKNRLVTTIGAVASAGLGAFTVDAASSGYRTFGAGDDGLTFDGITITEGTTWERRDGCVYTHSGTSLSRGTLMDSSTGSAITFTTAAIVTQGGSAESASMQEIANEPMTPGGRLTVTSATPVTTTDVIGATTLYYTPYLHDKIKLYDAPRWQYYKFTERSLSLTLTSGNNYDVFIYNNAGTLTLELSAAWTNDTTRADGLTTQDGVTVKSGATTRLWLGTIRASGTNTTEDSAGGTTTQVGGKRFVWNAYNQVQRDITVIDTATNWSYTTDTWRIANGATAPLNCVEYVTGDAAMRVDALLSAGAVLASNASRSAKSAIGLGSTTPVGRRANGYNANASLMIFPISCSYTGFPGLGYRDLRWLERGAAGSCSFIGDDVDTCQCGLNVTIWA